MLMLLGMNLKKMCSMLKGYILGTQNTIVVDQFKVWKSASEKVDNFK